MMKSYFKLFLKIFVLCISTSAFTQDNPRTVPSEYGSIPVNWVKVWEPVKPVKNHNYIDNTASVQEHKMSVQYLDGLGRSLQQVQKQGALINGNLVDAVSAIEYDGLGRTPFQYLPFTSVQLQGAGGQINDGSFKNNPFQQQAQFSAAQYSGETFFYGQTQFEESPLNRVTKTLAPGDGWIKSNRGVSLKYWVNTLADEVKFWTVTDAASAGDFGSYSSSNYIAGSLYKTVTIDEHTKQTIEFKDKEGKIILKKVQLTAVADDGNGVGHSGWLCTYYIYDDLNNLRCVIQPKAVQTLSTTNWQLSTTQLDELCFRYEYDYRNRMIVKKVPGAAVVQMVYDARDRLVLTQDGNLRIAQKWMYTQYDELNRPLATGLIADPSNYNNPSFHWDAAKNSIAYPDLASYSAEELSRTFYDNYDWRSSYGNPLTDAFNTAYSAYYMSASTTVFPYPETPAKSSATKGMVTGTRIKVLGTTDYLYTVNIYDHKGRLVQVHGTNVSGGTDISTTQYSFAGQPLVSIQKHQKSGTNAMEVVVATRNNLDNLGRLVKTEKNIDAGGWKTTSQLEYDALGQLKTKKLGTKPGTSTELAKLEHDYNIRGWLLSINKNYITASSNNDQYFGMELGYDKHASLGSFAAQYNGNISGQVWKSEGDGEKRKYDYSYDAVNRLTAAGFTQYVSGSGTTATFDISALIDFSVSNLTYDANGNILAQSQKGWKPGGSLTIDDMSYAYKNNGESNRLLAVTESSAINTSNNKLGDFTDKNRTQDDYDYDVNGNLILDKNKDILSITYNHLNLPGTITLTNNRSIEYVYDAGGSKLKKLTTEGGNTKTTLYMFGVYEDNVLQFLPHEEGRIRPVASGFTYDYFLKDHLGNVRMVLTEEQKTQSSSVSFEDAAVSTEQIVFENVDVSRVPKPATGSTEKAQLLQKSANAIGAGKLLKVMAGDRIHVQVDYYTPSVSTNNSTSDGVSTVLSSLLSLLNGTAAPQAFHGYGSAVQTTLNNDNSFTAFLNPQTTNVVSSDPKAYLNILFFDEQFKFVSSGSEIVQVSAKGSWTTVQRILSNAKEAKKNGYAYVYLSNESNNLVYFDNLLLSHERGRILEETHYYPFGLTMAGISSKSAEGMQNRYKFNDGTELNNDFDISFYETAYRSYDAQIGRFHQIDELADFYENWSPYVFAYDNPISFNDPLGLSADSTVKPGPDDPDAGSKLAEEKTLEEVVVYSTKKSSSSGLINFMNTSNRPEVVNMNNASKSNQSSDNGLLLLAGTAVLRANPAVTLVTAGAILGYTIYSVSQFEYNQVNSLIPPYWMPTRDNTTYQPPPVFLKAEDKTDHMGQPKGNTPGNNQVQNQQVKSLSKKYKLSKDEQRRLHNRISKEGYGYKEIEEIIKNKDF